MPSTDSQMTTTSARFVKPQKGVLLFVFILYFGMCYAVCVVVVVVFHLEKANMRRDTISEQKCNWRSCYTSSLPKTMA